MIFETPTPAFLLLLAPLACATTKPDRTPAPDAPLSAAAELDPSERTDGAPKPEFDEEGTYEMVKRYPSNTPGVPATALLVPATEDAVMIDPTLAAACDLPAPKVYFATDSANLRDSADEALDSLCACLQAPPLDDEPLVLVGRADPRGTDAYNRELGLDRANAVAAALQARGLSKDRITTYSRGEADASDDPDTWQQDRRVRIRLDR